MKNFSLLVFGLLALSACSFAAEPQIRLDGGIGPLQKPNDNVRDLVSKLDKDIKKEVCSKLNVAPEECKSESKLTVLGFKSQVVAGANYFVKVKCEATGQVFHLRIYEKKWENVLKIQGVDGPKKEDDEILYF